MSRELVEYNLDTREWGKLKLARPLPKHEDPWGMLAPLRGTPWGDLLPVVDGELLSHALHGHATPLVRVLGTPPKALLKKVPDPYRTCSRAGKCAIYHKDHCQPGPKLPDCYEPPELDATTGQLVTKVLLAWREDRYVIIVQGVEFSL